jgi:serine/threonine-protein kinase ATR
LNQIDGFQHSHASEALSLPFAVEASWVTGKLSKLRDCLALATENSEGDFNVGIGRALLALSEDRLVQFSSILENLRQITAKGLSMTNTASLQDCHEALLRFHVLTEIETISGVRDGNIADKRSPTASMNQRLDVLGPFLSDKQYILGLRRATMQLSK